MRMNRRNVLLGLGSLATISGGAIGTGAFSQVTAPRSAKVSVASDANAYLMLDATNSTSPLVGQTQQNNTIAFDFSGGTVNATDDVQGAGLNPQSKTTLPKAFTIGNHGTADVGVKAAVTEFAGSPTNSQKTAIKEAITFRYQHSNGTTYDLLWDNTSSDVEWVPFAVGESGTVEVVFDFTGTSLTGDLVNQITFTAKKNY